MTASDKVATTITWAKQLATGTYAGLAGRLLKNEFISRSKKPLVIYFLFFILISLAGHLSIRNYQEEHRETFIDTGLQAVTNMGEKISAPMLENDILTLNVAVGELEKKNNPVFTAILDHDGKIIAHSEPDAIGNQYISENGVEILKTDDDISISRINYKGNAIISFTKEIFFSKIKIGKIIFGVNAQKLDKALEKYNKLLAGLWIINIIIFIGALFFTDRYLRKKRARLLEEFEKTDKLGPYLLKKKIAQGGMAELYLADYIRGDGFKRTVAIKKILPHLAQNQDFVDMFIREARLAAMLQHPNIVQIFDLMKLHNSSFIVMEFVDGKNLAEIMAHEKKGLPVDLSIFLIQKISSGLYFSHTKKSAETNEPLNIIHRDVSPQNMLISFKGEVKISDFGISKARSEPSFTQAGVIKGKLSYLSPEQALGKETDHQSDLYALGIIFHEILSGKRLYHFSNELEALSTIPKINITPIIQLRPDVPDELNDIVMKCLEKDKGIRYKSGKEINDDLAQLRKRLNIAYDESNLVEFMVQRFK
ncbi:MAG: serine/threonine protein kinase [Desulfobacula sp.]|uniref:serine/threonine protein kinase n=1 Tax=Desulfobacula sp. TaxID=2593537 RepID=UPI0025C00B0E|nr:serine/threonine-protein kinase [Desulfobacula sp.]MCD4721608.1 serine/threonine protein kinase [Desulfobacula sp.]